MPPELSVKVIGNAGGRYGERGSEAKNGFFAFVKMGAPFEPGDVVQLLFGDLFFSADGRVEVNSKRTPDHQSDF